MHDFLGEIVFLLVLIILEHEGRSRLMSGDTSPRILKYQTIGLPLVDI